MTDKNKSRIIQINNREIPIGYKQIFESVVPNDWEEKNFGELFDFYGGLGKARDELGEKGIPYLHYGDMHRNTFNKVTYEQYLNEPKYDTNLENSETYLLKDGDVVFLDASEDLVGTSRSVMVENPGDKPFISGLHTIVARSKNDELDKQYKQYLTEAYYIKKQFMRMASGFKVYGLNRETLKKIRLAYPKDIMEQQKIVEILIQWDKAVCLQEKLIEELELQKKSLMQKLLTPKMEWKLLSLEDSGVTYGGLSGKNREDFGSGSKFITYMNIFSNQVIDVNCFELVKIGENENQNMVKYGDIFFTTSSETPEEVGMASVLLEEIEDTFLNSFCFGYRLNDFNTILPLFAAYYFRANYFRNILNTLAQGATRYNLSKNTLMKVKIPFPSLDEQRRISNILDAFSSDIIFQKKKLDIYKEQQKAMKQLLLNGIVRV